ncbi:TonB-dependent receptor [Novosphingobium umbonatum]|uniref:TonB-dependent receptor n=1 Tax=Novosphingobium umbonatum TaxID=1908524 RepID=A0A3S2VE29_9SPHN|nr:TonB-dependent receptor [Novosphingobium umbonatum]RVU05744.1 TonB-dependent receptor [Novosphingobium umbonatum]
MKRIAYRGVMPALLASTFLSFTAPAMAASAEEQAATAPTTDSGSIIVTARRRSETLQSTPVAITAVNAAMLENKNSVNIGDLQGDAPNLLITQQNSGAQAANIAIRGLSFANIEKSSTPTVGVVVDGVMMGTSTGQLQDFFDIEQIEVLRGPQGTLFGANTIGGVVNIQRSKPTMQTGAKLEASYGRWNSWNTRGVVNFGNGSSFGVKLWYYHNQSDGFYYNANLKRSAGGSKNDAYGASFLFKPEGSRFDAQLTIEQVQQNFDPTVANLTSSAEAFSAFMPANQVNRNTTTDLYTVFTQQANSNYRAPAATLQMNYTLDGVKLTSITGWRHSNEFQTQDFDGSSTNIYVSQRVQTYTQWSQELRAAGKLTDSLDYVVGGFFFDSKFTLDADTFVFGGNTGHNTVTGHTRSVAAFGDFNWAVADKVRISFGGRWSQDQRELSNAYPGTLGVIGNGSKTFSKVTPKIGIDWRPSSKTMLYGSWSRGTRSGGFSPRAMTAATAGTPYQPEMVDSFEVGTKLDLLERLLTFNVAGFYSKYTSMQQDVTLPGGPQGSQTITSNIGSADIMGAEFETTLRPAHGLKISATAAFLDSKFHGFVANNVCPAAILPTGKACPTANAGLVPFDYSGNRMIYSPSFSGSISAEYTADTSFGNVVTNVGLRHISPYDEQISSASLTPVYSGNTVSSVTVNGNDPRVRTVTQNLVDASITANFKINGAKAYVRVYGRNLANTRTTTHAFTVAGLWSFGSALEPTSYGATLGLKF